MKNNNLLYWIIGILIIILVILVLMVFSNSNGTTENRVNYTGERTQFIQSYQNISEAKKCEKDNECALSECGGCFSKDFLDTSEPELPCSEFEGYTCICETSQCTPIKR